MANNIFRQSYEILTKVLKEKAYLNLEMKNTTSKAVAKIVYGVMDKYYFLDYAIDCLTSKKPKINILILLYIAGYCLIFLKTPYNVVLNGIHEIMDDMGKGGLKPFADAIIKKLNETTISLPPKSDKRYLEVKYNMPSFLVGMYRKDYLENFEDIIKTPEFNRVHIRSKCKDEEIFKVDNTAIKTLTGFYVKNNKEISLLSLLGKVTYMGYSSSLVAESIKITNGENVLDVCAAPGGKAVMLAEKGANIIACDIYKHRLQLINDYAKRMKVNLKTVLADATIYNEKWKESFDIVLADVPCSGLGVADKKKDVVFNRSYEDIVNIAKLQYQILDNVKEYVKKGGLLVYSTCTVFNMENKDNINKFLYNNSDFTLETIDLPYENCGQLQFLPDGKGTEGFYICHMRKN